ncbi:cytochrome P450 [Trametes maxima]|nr:cytochrome P450 [Trametes maxima]
MSPLLWVALSFVAAFVAILYIERSRKVPLPPQPASPKLLDKPWKQYAKWSAELGPLVTVSAVGRPIVVINTVEAVLELLDKRSALFSCKPRWPMAELLGRQKNVGFTYYGDRLKRSRKVLHGALNPNAIIKLWEQLLESESCKLLTRFLNSPDTFYEDVNTQVEELVVRFTYGKKPEPEYVELAKTVMHQTGVALQPGRWAVNSFPILMYLPAWMPGAGFQRWARNAKETFFRLTRVPFSEVKEKLAEGKAEDSFVKHALESSRRTEEEEDIIMSAAGSLYSAGTDTLAGFILNALLLLTRNPDVQKRVYEEIVSAVGTDRLPGLEDRLSLPYFDCVIREIHRFNPAIPLVTHANSQQDEYLGYTIPKKTWLMANVWAMLHDEQEYPNPEEFRPERFEVPEGKEPPRDPRTLVFGFGRRLCPGMHLANHFLYLTVARAVALFELRPEVQDGEVKMPPLDFVTGLVPAPKPFKCVITPRPNAEELLRMAREAH